MNLSRKCTLAISLLLCLLNRNVVGVFLASEPSNETHSESQSNRTKPQVDHYDSKKDHRMKGRIIGGAEVQAHKYPFITAMYVYDFDNQALFCGGSLITTKLVLTAAHCPEGANYIDVLLGVHDTHSAESDRLNYRTKEWFIHEKWNRDHLQHDIAIIKLPKSAELSDHVQLISYETEVGDYLGEKGLCLGWGLTNDGKQSPVLRFVNLVVISNTKCVEHGVYANVITDRQFCTSGDGVVGSCNGDSGGPFVINGTLVGVVSFGVNDCKAEYPSIYTKVASYKDWIERTVQVNKSDPLNMEDGLLLFLYFYSFSLISEHIINWLPDFYMSFE